MRLSRDGLTPISDYGMSDWFKDNLKISNTIIGSYDDRNDEYNVKLTSASMNQSSQKAYWSFNSVLTYSERVKGWVSFKSFTDMELGDSMANDYYTFKDGEIWRHHEEVSGVGYNKFYGEQHGSTLTAILNDNPGVVKTFNTINYEGSEQLIVPYEVGTLILPFQPPTVYNDQGIDNLYPQGGWSIKTIETDLEKGGGHLFKEKEGKYFTNITRNTPIQSLSKMDTADFTFQGIGIVNSAIDDGAGTTISCPTVEWNLDSTTPQLTGSITSTPAQNPPTSYHWRVFGPGINAVEVDSGFSGFIPTALATISGNVGLPVSILDNVMETGNWKLLVDFYWVEGNTIVETCSVSDSISIKIGCMEGQWDNYDPVANWPGICENDTDPAPIYGCTNPLADNYDPLATIDNGSCIILADDDDDYGDDFDTGDDDDDDYDDGDSGPSKWVTVQPQQMKKVIDVDSLTNDTKDDREQIRGCTNPNACNYEPTATVDNGSCILPDGCTDPKATNYDPRARCDDGSCIYPEPSIEVGDYYGGGVVFSVTTDTGDRGPATDPPNAQIATMSAVTVGIVTKNPITTAQWGCMGNIVSNLQNEVGAGPSNTDWILSRFSELGCTSGAAIAARNYDDGSWSLPNQLEMDLARIALIDAGELDASDTTRVWVSQEAPAPQNADYARTLWFAAPSQTWTKHKDSTYPVYGIKYDVITPGTGTPAVAVGDYDNNE